MQRMLRSTYSGTLILIMVLTMVFVPSVSLAETSAEETINGCKGKTAEEALSTARELDYKAKFVDTADVDVTGRVEDENAGDVRKAKVGSVELKGGFLFFRPSVTFKIEYTDEDAASKRKAESDRREALEGCVGKTASEAYGLAKESGYVYRFIDLRDRDIADHLKDGSGGEAVNNAPVKNVKFEEGWLFLPETVVFTVDCVDMKAKMKGPLSDEEWTEDSKAIEACAGKSAAEAIAVAESLGYQYDFSVPSVGRDRLVSIGPDSKYLCALRRIPVTEVENKVDRKEPSKTGSYITFYIHEELIIRPEDDETLLQGLSDPDPSDELIEAFNEKFEDAVIEFDGCVIDATKCASSYGYYDYEIRFGDYGSDAGSARMNFKDADNLGSTGRFQLTRSTPVGQDAIGGNYHFTCKVRGYWRDTREIGLDKQYATRR